MEFLVRTTVSFPPDLSAQDIRDLRAQERTLAMALRTDGILKRLWRLPGKQGTLGLYETKDATHLHDVLTSLPLFPYLAVEVEALATHPQEMAAPGPATVPATENGSRGTP